MKRPTVTRAQIERALEAGKRKGAVALEIEVGDGKVKYSYSLANNNVESFTAKLEKKRRSLI